MKPKNKTKQKTTTAEQQNFNNNEIIRILCQKTLFEKILGYENLNRNTRIPGLDLKFDENREFFEAWTDVSVKISRVFRK